MTATRLIFLGPEGEEPRIVMLASEGVGDILVVPGSEAAAHWLDLPSGGDKQARAAAAFMLADELAGGDPHIALGRTETDGQRLVVTVDKARLQGWLDAAAGFGVTPAAALPDYLLLPEGDEVLTTAFGPLRAVRGERLAFSAEPDLADTILDGRPSRALSDAELETAMAERGPALPVDLLQGEFAHREASIPHRRWRRAVVLAALVVLSPLILTLAAAARDEMVARELTAKAQAAAAQMAPDAADPLAAVEARMNAHRAADAFPLLAADFYKAVEAVPGMRMDMLVYSDDEALRTSVAYGAYSDMDGLRKAAAGSGIELEETSTLTEPDHITSEIIVRRRP